MSTSTGFVLGVGTIAVAICVGFAGGYMLTKTDRSQKIGPPGYALGGSSGPAPATEPRVHEGAHQVKESAMSEPSVPSLVKPAEASTVGMTSADIVAPSKPTTIAQDVKTPESKEEKASAPRHKRAIPPRRAASTQKREQKITSEDRGHPDMEELRQAVEADIRRRQTMGHISQNSLP